jgi:IclR family acetate operon transcriptional repressor
VQEVSQARTDSGDRGRGILLTLEKGLRILEAVADSQGQATAKSLSQGEGIHVGTCYQILRTLHVQGYVERYPGGRYGLGQRLGFLLEHYELTATPPTGVLDVLRGLHDELDESVDVSLRQGSKIAIAAQLEGTKAVRVGPLQVGYSDYPHARATSKCFLAFTDPDELGTFLGERDLEALTRATITDWATFLDELQRIRTRGYAQDVEEFQEGVGCVSAVLVDRDGVAVGALGISVPVDRFRRSQEALIRAAQDAGRRASLSLGFQGVYPPVLADRARADA